MMLMLVELGVDLRRGGRVPADRCPRGEALANDISRGSRALRALSSTYVERRQKIADGAAGAGKRAAFALFYGPLRTCSYAHDALPGATRGVSTLVDPAAYRRVGAAWVRVRSRRGWRRP